MALNANRNIRLVCFDLDGTLIDRTVFIWSTLHEYFRSDPFRRRKAAEEYRAGVTSYAQWFATDLDLLKEAGADRESMLQALKTLKVCPGASECIQTLKDRGYRLGVISGSLDLVLDQFFPDAPFDHVLINRVHFDAQGKISGGIPTPYDLEGKAVGLAELARREGITPSECAFIGDNLNDLAVMSAAGYAVGVNIKSREVAAAVDLVCQDSDLRAILPHFPGPERSGHPGDSCSVKAQG